MKDLLAALEKVPLTLRQGPWSPIAIIYLISFFAYLIYSYPLAIKSIESIDEPEPSQYLTTFRLISSCWGVVILISVIIGTGWWPLVSYTITSWNFLWLRMFFASIDSPHFKFIARLFKFPALAGCTITVSIWWSILVPLIHYLMGDKQKQKAFWEFNTSFLLLNIHLLNLPLSVVEFVLSESRLVFFDIWIGLSVAFLYIIFYLAFLDSRGIHLYIILTPRTPWCFIVYSIILSIYYACYVGWNSVLN